MSLVPLSFFNTYVRYREQYPNLSTNSSLAGSPFASTSPSLEVEARYNEYSKGGTYGSGISLESFTRLITFWKSSKVPYTLTDTIDYIDKTGTRKTVYRSLEDVDRDGNRTQRPLLADTFVRKNKLYSEDNNNYLFRLSINLETPVQPYAIPDANLVLIRSKKRYSFKFPGGLQLDLTQSGSSKDNYQPVYEMEVEFNDPKLVHTEMEKQIKLFLVKLQDTHYLYTFNEYKEIVTYMNQVLNPALPRPNQRYSNTVVNSDVMYQARNLHLRDLIYTAIEVQPYWVTYKTDGERRLMVIHQSGIWLVLPPYFMTRVTLNFERISLLAGYILEGELVPKDKRIMPIFPPLPNQPKAQEILLAENPVLTSKYWFLVYDCLSVPAIEGFPDQARIQSKPHFERMREAQIVSDNLRNGFFSTRISDQILSVTTKLFKSISQGTASFFQTFRELERLKPFLLYKEDGYIIMPQNAPYTDRADLKFKKCLSNLNFGYYPQYVDSAKKCFDLRKLTKTTDVCKWKQIVTIDFLYNRDRGQNFLWSMVKGNMVAFQGTPQYPFNGAVDTAHPLLQNLPGDTVVEFMWDQDRQLMVPIVIRTNKTFPNSLVVAVDNWELINDPISIETLKGESVNLMRQYHNKIKWTLYSIPARDRPKTLLDLGAGRGGDVFKWKVNNFDRVVAVEPDLENLNEMVRRIKDGYGFEPTVLLNHEPLPNQHARIVVVQAKAEETDYITSIVGKFSIKVDVVTAMLSMSFFWESKEKLTAFVDTIGRNLASGGQFLFFTIDGDIVQQTFEPSLSTGLSIDNINVLVDNNVSSSQELTTLRANMNKIDFGPVTMVYKPESRSVYIDIKESIVRNQTEWLVHLDDLQILFKPYNIKLKSLERADKEKLLNPLELTLSRMYSYGYFQMQSKDTDIVIETRKAPFFSVLPVPTEKVAAPLLPPPLPVPLTLPVSLPPSELVTVGGPVVTTTPQVTLPLIVTAPSSTPSTTPITTLTLSPPTTLPSVTQPTKPLIEDRVRKEEIEDNKTIESITESMSNLEITNGPILDVNQVPALPVDKVTGIGDDVYQRVQCSWYTQYPVVRIGTIGDGSCFFHALLKTFYPPYADYNGPGSRRKIVKDFRHDLAVQLGSIDPITNQSYYNTVIGGRFPEIHKSVGTITDSFGQKIDFSLKGLQELLDSNLYVGDEVYAYTAEQLNLDITILLVTSSDITVLSSTRNNGNGKSKYTVYIAGNGEHYEPIGILKPIDNDPTRLAIQTVFDDKDGFYIANKVAQISKKINYEAKYIEQQEEKLAAQGIDSRDYTLRGKEIVELMNKQLGYSRGGTDVIENSINLLTQIEETSNAIREALA